MTIPFVEFTVYPDECDAYGHLNQASFLSLFERARWEVLARTTGMDLFTAAGVWPVVRRTTIEYHAQALPGERLRFEQRVAALGRTSFTISQTARNAATGGLVATVDIVLVCIDQSGRPVPVPDTFRRAATAAADHHRFEINGVTLAVESKGDGPALLLIHGYPLGGYLWRHLVDHLAGWRLVNPDLRGLGQSMVLEGTGRIEQYADDLIALLDMMKIDRAVICGHSLGGYIAFNLLQRHRDRITGLILTSTRASGENADGVKGREAAIDLARRSGPAAIAETMVPRLFAPDAGERIPLVVADVRNRIAAGNVTGVVQALEAMRDRKDSRDLLASLANLPVLILAGAVDQAILEPDMRALAAAIPGAVYQVIDGAGHLAPLEQPDALTSAVANFLGRIPA